MVIDDSKPNPSAVRSRLREWEDYNLAVRLQDREYDMHYDQNRTERRTVGSDTKHSKREQQHEDETARQMRRAANRQIEETDEQIAQRLAMEWDSAEQRKMEEKLRQELIDEQIAKRLAETAEYGSYSGYGEQSVPSRNTASGDLLIDFSSPTPSNSQAEFSTQSSSQPGSSVPRGIPLPGLAPQTPSVLPPPLPPAPSVLPTSDVESPVSWPPPPPSVFLPPPPSVATALPKIQYQLSSNNPFLTDLMVSNTGSTVAPPTATVLPPSSAPSIGFRSDFVLPQPSALALGSGVYSQNQPQPPPYQ